MKKETENYKRWLISRVRMSEKLLIYFISFNRSQSDPHPPPSSPPIQTEITNPIVQEYVINNSNINFI